MINTHTVFWVVFVLACFVCPGLAIAMTAYLIGKWALLSFIAYKALFSSSAAWRVRK